MLAASGASYANVTYRIDVNIGKVCSDWPKTLTNTYCL